MDTPKVEKVDERPYWTKHRCWLSLSLADIRVELCLSVNHPKAPLPSKREDVELESEAETKAELGDETKLSREEEEKYSETFGWRIRAIGHFEHGDSIGLFSKDGTVSEGSKDFHYADVFLKPTSDAEKEKAVGHLFYDDAKYSERKPY